MKKGKKQLQKKKRKAVTSDEESSEEDPVDVHARMRDCHNLAKAAYDSRMAQGLI